MKSRKWTVAGAALSVIVVASCSTGDGGAPYATGVTPGAPEDGGGGPSASTDATVVDAAPSLSDAAVNEGAPPEAAAPGKVLPGPSRGSAIALSPDESIAVVCNRDAGSVTVFSLSYAAGQPPSVTLVKELDAGAGSEPWQAVVAPDNNTAFVLLRRDRKVLRIDSLQYGPVKATEQASTGSEPTGIALTPTGAQAWVANWVDGTLTPVDVRTMTAGTPVDLNAALAATGLLGSVAPRPGLAHPRALAITNNGDASDDDESIYAVDYFAARKEPEASDGANSDTSRRGIAYRIRSSDRSVKVIELHALADMGFKDSKNGLAGCFPNQLQSITLAGKFAFVTSVCASPKGPLGPVVAGGASPISCTTVADCPSTLADPVCVALGTGSAPAQTVCVDVANFKTATAPVVSVIDTTPSVEAEVVAAAANLNAKFRDLYVSKAVGDNAARRYPLFAGEMSFVPGTMIGYVAANGADAIFRVKFDAGTGAVTEVGPVSGTNFFIDLKPAGIAPEREGTLPVGLAVTGNSRGVALTVNDFNRNVSVIDLNGQALFGGAANAMVLASSPITGLSADAQRVRKGKKFFNTGLGRWSLKGQAWGACQQCHSDGLTDNVTWYFGRGPRQSTSLDGTFSKKYPSDQRVLNWTAIFDELADFEANTRGVSGGVGAIVKVAGPPIGNTDRIDLANITAGSPSDTGSHDGLNGSATDVANPANPLQLPPGSQSVLDDWANITRYVQTIRPPRAVSTLDVTKVKAGRDLFLAKNCGGCHGDDKWTISRVFYTPSRATTTALNSLAWAPPAGFPPDLLPIAGGAPPTPVMRTAAAGGDQIQCILRNVSTFGVAEAGVGIAELRQDMTTVGQGNANNGKGYNPPSLFGMATGAPYLHAGNARTLEALFTDTFRKHHQGLAQNFLDGTDANAAAQRDQLVAFLLSIDTETTVVPSPTTPGNGGGNFCATP